MSQVLDELVGTFRRVMDGDMAASARVGRWAEALLTDEAQDRLHLLLGWLERVQLRSMDKWFNRRISVRCSVVSPVGACRARAAGACACCGRPVCLQHSMISMDADLLCAPCFAVARKHADRFEPEPEPKAAPEPEQPDLDKACRVLGVDLDASEEHVRKVYKEKLRRNHPDGKKSAAAKARAESRFKEIRAAWDTIAKTRGFQ